MNEKKFWGAKEGRERRQLNRSSSYEEKSNHPLIKEECADFAFKNKLPFVRENGV